MSGKKPHRRGHRRWSSYPTIRAKAGAHHLSSAPFEHCTAESAYLKSKPRRVSEAIEDMLPDVDADSNWNTDDSMSAIDEYDIVTDGVDAGHAAVESMIAMSYARTPLLQSALPDHHAPRARRLKTPAAQHPFCEPDAKHLSTDRW